MVEGFSRRGFVAALASSLAGPALANAPIASLRPKLRPVALDTRADPLALIQAADLRGAVGYAVADAVTGEIIEAHNGNVGLPPASVTKAVTALYALDTMGPSHRFYTRFVATAPVADGVIDGDLILVGGGDPTLDTDRLQQLVARLAATGLKRITGRFLVYGGMLPSLSAIDGGQPAQVGYSPAVSGICLNFNRVYLEWKVGANGPVVTLDGRSETVKPRVDFATVRLSDRKAPVYAFDGSKGKDEWSLAKGALQKNGGRWLPVRQPERYVGDVARWSAARQGISLPHAEKTTSSPKGKELASIASAQLVKILQDMLKYSTNITAEMVGLSATRARGLYAASLRASGREMADWSKTALDMRNVKFVDHSGLGDASRIPAKSLVSGLANATQKARLHPILKNIVIKDAQGRPKHDHPVKVSAKTGTLNYVSGLAGYVTKPDGQELAFAIFAADLKTRSNLTRAQRERPKGARSWNARARNLQQRLIERWSVRQNPTL